jgi:uncharacterized protein YqhQ
VAQSLFFLPQNGGWFALLKYFKACGGYWIMSLILVAIFLFCMARLATSVWLQVIK